MKFITNKIRAFVADEKGAEIVEWIIVVGLLLVIAIAVYGTNLTDGLNDKVDQIIAAMSPT